MAVQNPPFGLDRRRIHSAEMIFKEAGVSAGSKFMDIGCGDGFFTLPAAQQVGADGLVYALDINRNSIETLKKKAAEMGLKNIEYTVGKAEENIICEACADFVFFGIVLHDFESAPAVLRNARKMIKPNGKLINLDWKKKIMSFGPPLAKRFSEETAGKLIEDAGFVIESVKDHGRFSYLIIARPAAAVK